MRIKKQGQHLLITIDEEYENRPLSDLWADLHLSRKTIHLLKQNKDYKVNHVFSMNPILHTNDVLDVLAYEHDDGTYAPDFQDIDIVYEDDLILVVNKPIGIAVYPDDPHKTDSLSNRVSAYYMTQGYDIPVRYIHRLDNDTSGLVVFCKCHLIQAYLDHALSIKEIQREYLAYVEGNIKEGKEYKIEQNLGKDRHSPSKMRVHSKGIPAVTYYQCLENKEDHALVRCRLETGRKHQIRVHMASIGHPILGDPLYNEGSDYPRLALHAAYIKFEEPITHLEINLYSPMEF